MSAWTHEVAGGPWPERDGLRCRLVDKPAGPEGDRYPWREIEKTDQAVIFIEDDPFNSENPRDSFSGRTDEERGWTCVLDMDDLEPLAAKEMQ